MKRKIVSVILSIVMLVFASCGKDNKIYIGNLYTWSQFDLTSQLVKYGIDNYTEYETKMVNSNSISILGESLVNHKLDIMGIESGSIGSVVYNMPWNHDYESWMIELQDKLTSNNYSIAILDDCTSNYMLVSLKDFEYNKTSELPNHLVVGCEPAVYSRDNSINFINFLHFYDKDWKIKQADLSLLYMSVLDGQLDLCLGDTYTVYEYPELKLIDDDLNFFPSYEMCVMYNNDLPDDVKNVINIIDSNMSYDKFMDYISRINSDEASIPDIVKEFWSQL